MTVRFAPDHGEHFRRRAAELGIPTADYIVYRAAICEELEMPPEALRSYPRLIMLYEPTEWPAIIARMPFDVIERLRRVPEVLPYLPPVEDLTGCTAQERIWQLRDQELSLRAITTQLNREGWHAPKGGPWYVGAVQKALKARNAQSSGQTTLTGC